MNKKRIFLCSACFFLVLAGAAAKCFLDRNIWAGSRFYPRSAAVLDLREEKLSLSDYRKLQNQLPDCEILWSVPFQGSVYSDETEYLRIDTLTQEDCSVLAYFPKLSHLDATNCEDFPQLLAFQASRPDCKVTYQVTIGEQSYSNDTAVLRLENAAARELEEKLPWLPLVREVWFTGQLPSGQALDRLQETFPEVSFLLEIPLGDTVLKSNAETLDLSDRDLDKEALMELLDCFPNIKYVDIRGCRLTDREMMELADCYSQCFFLWDMTFGEKTLTTDARELDLSGQVLEGTQELEELLPYFPNLEKVVMCHCGLDDETMDALDKRYANIRFVWSVLIKDVYVRTDATWFYPFKYYRNMVVDDEDLYPLRYCVDMEAIDIGHMTTVTNCEWVRFMPNLKYLIIVETAITDISPLAQLKNLVFLEIFTTNITDYTPLLECTSLEDLNLGKTYGDPAPIAQMTWLKNLWWSGVQGTVGNPASRAPEILREALPNTRMKFNLNNPNVENGWRQLDNYYAMRDLMDVFYLP